MPLFAIILLLRAREDARRAAKHGDGIEVFFPYAEGGRYVGGEYIGDEDKFGRKLEQYASNAEMR